MTPPGTTRARALRALPLAVGLAALSACGSPPSTTFDLSAVAGARGRVDRGQVVVLEPAALSYYDSDRIVVRASGNTVTYLPRAAWSERLPRLLQTRLIQTIENANRFRGVGRPGGGISAAYRVETEVRAFEVSEERREAVVALSIKLVGETSGRIVAGDLFVGRQPVGAIDGPAAAAALDAALTQALTGMAAWIGARA